MAVQYESTRTIESQACPGVKFTVQRMSFERRLALIRKIREVSGELGFRQAGQSPEDQIAAAEINATVESIYLRWGLQAVEGLRIDGVDANPDLLLERGPDSLCREIVAEVRRECGLTEEERKN